MRINRSIYQGVFFQYLNSYPNINSGKKKLEICNENTIEVITKQTTLLEFQQLRSSYEYLKKRPILLKNVGIKILPVEVYNWNDKTRELKTKFIKGYNLEVLLTNIFSQHRDFLISFIAELFSQLKNTGFLWGDLAPRNIIIDNALETAYLCDFERPLYLKYSSVSENEFDFYIGNYSLEEFSSLTFASEQKTIFPTRTSNNNSTVQIDKNHISSRRKLCLLKILFGQSDSYTIKQVSHSEELIAKAVTPFIIANKVFFPMIHLDKQMLSKPKVFFAELVLELNNLTENEKYEKILSLDKSF